MEVESLTLKADLSNLADQLDQANQEGDRLRGLLQEAQTEKADYQREGLEMKEMIRAMQKEVDMRVAEEQDLQ